MKLCSSDNHYTTAPQMWSKMWRHRYGRCCFLYFLYRNDMLSILTFLQSSQLSLPYVLNGNRTIASWTIAPRTITLLITPRKIASGQFSSCQLPPAITLRQLPPGQLPSKPIAPKQEPLGQLPPVPITPRTIIPQTIPQDNCPLCQLPPGQLTPVLILLLLVNCHLPFNFPPLNKSVK